MRKRIMGAVLAVLALVGAMLTPELFTDAGPALAMIFGTRKLEGSELFGISSRRTKRLASNSLVADLKLAVDYAFKNAGTDPATAGDAVGTLYPDAAYRLWRMITARGEFQGRSVTFMNVVPRDLHKLYKYLDPKLLPQTEPALTGTGVVEQNLRTEIPLRFDALGADDPSQLGLPLMAIKGFEVVTDGGEAVDLVFGEAGVDPTLLGADGTGLPATEAFEKRFLRMRRVPAALMTLHASYDVTASQDGQRFYLPEVRPGLEVARVMAIAEVDDAANNAVIENIGLVLDGREVMEKIPVGVYQRANVGRYDIDAATPGVTLFDFAEDGKFSDLYTISSTERPYVLADVAKQAGTNTVRIVAQYVERQAANGKR